LASLRSLSYERGPAGHADPSELELLHVALQPASSETSTPLPPLTRDVPSLDPTPATPVDLLITMNAGSDGNLAPRIDAFPASGTHIAARVGELQLWSVTNLTEWDHPF